MADSQHLAILMKDKEVWNEWRQDFPSVIPDLSRADLRNAQLSRLKLSDARLTSADLSDADLSFSSLDRAELARANLTRANLSDARLSLANLAGANLTVTNLARASLLGARLPGVDLRGAFLKKTNLSFALLWDTHLHRVDLREVQGLEDVEHGGPSPVSAQTLEMSKGQIPEGFLKGCGFTDWSILTTRLFDPKLRQDEVIDLTYRIAAMRGGTPIVPLSVFLSYNHKDTEFVEKLEAQFDSDGIRSWRDTHDLLAGPIEPQIDSAINAQQAVLLVLSRNSADSSWVPWEVERAKEAEVRTGGYKLCPVALDDEWLDCSWPRHVISYLKRRYYVLPLHGWEDDQVFEEQYQKLKKGLGIFYRDQTNGPDNLDS